MEQDRFMRGWKKMQEIDGEAGERVKNSLKDISQDLGRYIIEYSFGDVYSREGLTLKQKEIAVVAALTAMGNASPQLRVHLHGALNVGCSVDEVKEVILQMAVYAGFPAAINGMNALKEVLLERNQTACGHPTLKGGVCCGAARPGFSEIRNPSSLYYHDPLDLGN